ncbi:predicted protein [Naegleria gruberi]|uniref:Predicted protein n=1 Tax=Naegleria gruberi TaxID=5762 RepID=D2VD67_NAEGR|nr:uncharacterized protein NAEGRDRAFT_66924 [Naegleria gruberi]EFC45277.1 predicted protein [Naegleria gruberi]|eukprot:XP_002678021.1 predicted protein [Naegleria gruberi strain NEG-M]
MNDLEVIEKFMMRLIENFPPNFRSIVYSIPHLKKHLQNNVEFVIRLARVNVKILLYTSTKVLETDRFFEWALEEKHTAIRFCNLKRKQKFMKRLIQIDANYLEKASMQLREDPDFVMDAIKQSPFVITYASKSLTENVEFLKRVRKELNNFFPLAYAPEEWKDDKELVLNVVSKYGMELEHASYRLRNDR